MFIEHIDRLRCTTAHQESWLVAAFGERDDRFILRATLGCPLCYRRYPIVDGVAYFGVDPARGSGTSDTRLPGAPDSPPDPERAIHAAAFLNATERATLVVGGAWGGEAHALAELLPMTVFALDPTTTVRDSERVGVIVSSEGIPLAAGSVDGVALDVGTATPRNLETALRVLRPGGRLVAPAAVTLPPAAQALVRELARDARYWVAETVAPLVTLARR